MNIELNILNKKLELIQWLSTIEDSTIIEKIMDLRKKESKDWWNSISESEKEAIERGIQDANAGKLNPHSKARKIYEKWL
jgi:predicted transcriptional regulator